jgi:hypothetical protein
LSLAQFEIKNGLREATFFNQIEKNPSASRSDLLLNLDSLLVACDQRKEVEKIDSPSNPNHIILYL